MKNNKLKVFLNGLLFENPTFVIFLGMCPALGTTNTLENALYMSLCVLAVLMLSNIIISAIRKIVPNEVRIPVYIIIIATLVSIIDMLFHAFLDYSVYQSLGSFISLIVVNCIILGRAEAFASKNSVIDSIVDAAGYALGFAGAIIVVALFREVVSTGTLSFIDKPLMQTAANFGLQGNDVTSLLPETPKNVVEYVKYKNWVKNYTISLFGSNAGAFIALGLVVALYTAIMNACKDAKAKKEKLAKEKAAAEAKTVKEGN